MTRGSGLFSLCFVLLASCGELSKNPGGNDAGERRTPCHGCEGSDLQACWQGECVWKCFDVTSTGYECSRGSHCVVSHCARDVEPGCAALPCTAAQVCVSDRCVVRSDVACSTLDDPACGDDALCDTAAGRCFALPDCDLDFTCRPGTLGATCSRIATAAPARHPRVVDARCLIGFCGTDADCPPGRHCVGAGETYETLGECR